MMHNIAPMTVRQAAERAGVHYSLMRAAVRNGRIRTVIISRRPMITSASLTRWLREIEQQDTETTSHTA